MNLLPVFTQRNSEILNAVTSLPRSRLVKASVANNKQQNKVKASVVHVASVANNKQQNIKVKASVTNNKQQNKVKK